MRDTLNKVDIQVPRADILRHQEALQGNKLILFKTETIPK